MKNKIKKSGCAVLSAFGMVMSVNGSNVAVILTYVGLISLSASATLYYHCVFGSKYSPGGLFGTEQGSVRMTLHTAWFFKQFTKVW